MGIDNRLDFIDEPGSDRRCPCRGREQGPRARDRGKGRGGGPPEESTASISPSSQGERRCSNSRRSRRLIGAQAMHEERERERERERVEGIDALQSIKTRWQSADDCDIVADPRDRQKKTTKNKTHTLDFFFFGPPLFFDVFFIFFFSIFLPEMCVSIFLFEFLHNFRFPFFFWFLVCLFVCLFSWCACPLVPRQSIRRGVGKSKPSREKKNKRDPLPFCSMAANQRTGNLTDLTRDGEMKKSLEPSLQRIADSGLIKKPVRGSVKKKEKKKQKKTFLFSFPSNDILPLRIVIWEKKRRKFQSS